MGLSSFFCVHPSKKITNRLSPILLPNHSVSTKTNPTSVIPCTYKTTKHKKNDIPTNK